MTSGSPTPYQKENRMRLARMIFTSILTVASCLVVGASPSQAQGIRYEVSESTTNQRIVGWEHNLTERDPNLSKWHWEPINTSAHNINVKKIVDPANPTAVAPVNYEKSHYVKPIHVAFPTVTHNSNGYNGNSNSRSQSDVAAKLVHRTDDAPITAQARPVATYKDYSSREYSAVSTAAARANVVGTIIHKSGRRSACNESPKYF